MKPYFFSMIVLLACAIASMAQAGPSEDAAITGMGRCLSVIDDHARLICYDGVGSQVRAALSDLAASSAHTPASSLAFASGQPSRPPATAPQKKGWFGGLFGSDDKTRALHDDASMPVAAQVAAGPSSDRFSARITNYSIAPMDHTFTVVLDNGQVWQEGEGDPTIAALNKPARSYIASIEPSLLGGHKMHIQGVSGVFNVHRIR